MTIPSQLISSLGLFAVLLLTAIAYWGGLHGAFYFDDYGQIVWNSGLVMKEFSWPELWAAASSSDAGPLGRPIAMGSFAIEQYFLGQTPYHFKLVNLFIHLGNVALVAFLTTELLQASSLGQFSASNSVSLSFFVPAVAVTAWWAFHPLGVTGVLYIVQRMTSLSALFTLLALGGYLQGRRKHIESGQMGWLVVALSVLVICGFLSMLCKENGALTFGFVWLVEVLVLRFRCPTQSQERFLRTLCLLGPLLVLLAAALFFISHPDWIARAYQDRAFNLEQRLLTETRVMWFYLRQIVMPNSGALGLYHDGFPLSSSLWQPWTTLVAIVGHVVLIGSGWWLRRHRPLAALGIFWFYLGHVAESTIVPLELVFEHRNYLPQYGILLACVSLVTWGSNHFLKARILLLGGLVFLSLVTTALRAHAMGERIVYPVYEATRHPGSSRANFDAGLTIAGALGQDPVLSKDYYEQSRQFFDRSRRADLHSLAPFVGMMKLSSVSGVSYPADYLDEFESRLKHGVPPRASSFIARILGEQLAAPKPILSIDEGRRLYQAAIENQLLTGYSRACWEAGYGLFLFNIVGDQANGLALMRAAVADAPSHADLWVFLTAMLISSGDISGAESAIAEATRQDRKGYSADDLAKLRQGLGLLKSGKHAIQ